MRNVVSVSRLQNYLPKDENFNINKIFSLSFFWEYESCRYIISVESEILIITVSTATKQKREGEKESK